MAIHLTAYAAPIIGGTAFVTPEPTLAALSGAGRILADTPKAVQLVLCVPETAVSSVDVVDDVVRTLLRRAAVAATASRAVAASRPAPAIGRLSAGVRRTVTVFGWLLLLFGGSISAGVGGLWLAFGFPLLRRRTLEHAETAGEAEPLARVIAGAPLVERPHAGLTALRTLITSGVDPAADRYRRASAACIALGAAPLADFYGALARDAAPAMPWAQVAAEEVGDGPLHEPN